MTGDNSEFELEAYFSEVKDLIWSKETPVELTGLANLFLDIKLLGGRVIFFGNGASASIASHLATDLTKQAGIEALTFHDINLITALSNDYGYDMWCRKALEFHSLPNDMLVLVSVSGESQNLVNAAKFFKDSERKVVTFTGKNTNNSLAKLGDVNLHVPSHAYNIVEGIHMMWLTSVVDMIIGKSVYSVS